jgi:hypothetical protein
MEFKNHRKIKCDFVKTHCTLENGFGNLALENTKSQKTEEDLSYYPVSI